MVKRFYCYALAWALALPVIAFIPVVLLADAVREAAWPEYLFYKIDWLINEADRD